MTVLDYVTLHVQHNSFTKPHKFFVISSLSKKVYLGYDFWKSFKIAPELHKSFEICDLDLDVDIKKEDPKMHDLSPEEQAKLEEIKILFPSSTVH